MVGYSHKEKFLTQTSLVIADYRTSDTRSHTMNNSSVEFSRPYCLIWDSQAARIGAVVLYAILFVLSVVGNVLVVIVVYRNKSLRNSTNYFIVNMAVSDLLVPILIISRNVKVILSQSSAWDVSGVSGEVLCKLFHLLADVPPAVSILSLICISCNRFCAVMFPLRHKKSCVPRYVTIALTWIISFAALAPNLYAYKLTNRDEGDQLCQLNWEPAFDFVQAQKAYTTFIIVSFIFIPSIMLSFIYINICAVIIKQKVIGVDRSERGHAIRDRKTRTVVRLSITIVFANAVCWAPYGVFLLLYSFKYNWKFPNGCKWLIYYQLAQISGVSNAAINPAIYFIFVQSYKKELKRILTYVSRLVPSFSHAGLLTAQPQKMEMEPL